MRIRLVTPASRGIWTGNRTTATRWARILRSLGHRVAVEQEYRGGSCDLLVALHARKSHPSIVRFRRRHADAAVVAALTGTDLYRDLATSARARRSLEWASRLIVLQPRAIHALPPHVRGKARVIHQSAVRPKGRIKRSSDAFEVALLCHARPVKDPFRAARAARLLPPSSRTRILHVGAALDARMAARARAEQAANPRYRWLGPLPRWRALRVLARARLLVVTSRIEGGANVVSEALAAAVPVLSSRIDGSVGLLGAGYPGYFPAGDTRALAALLARAEADPAFYRRLEAWCRRLAPLVSPARELRSWKRLLGELGG